ncbi:MAG: response regulator [Planctomycetes bacterium]|nr:response regulator [Planctomycetota bacterium]
MGKDAKNRNRQTGQLKVLLVEDNQADVELIRQGMADTPGGGLEFVLADSLARANELIRQTRFDAILLDLFLPDCRGMDTYVNMQTACPTVPIVVMTGIDDRELAIQTIRRGAQDYLVKGRINGEVISRVMQYSIERSRLHTQLRMIQKMEAVSRMIGGIAHDFRNQLTVIKGYCEMILPTLRDDDSIRQALDEIHQAAERAGKLTSQMSMLSKTKTGVIETLDLAKAISDLESLLRQLVPRDIELQLSIPEGPVYVLIDPGLFQQAIANLVINAGDSMPNGGRLLIGCTSVQENHIQDVPKGLKLPAAAVSVSDTGVGMDSKLIADLFEPFFITQSTTRTAGIGLSVVSALVRQFWGDIKADSAPGKGTTITMYFPKVARPQPSAEPKPAAPASIKGSETILVVEDEEFVRTLMVQILTHCGYKVMQAGDGKEGLEILERLGGKIDLLLTDIVMPVMNGMELAMAAKKVIPKIPVIFISGYSASHIPNRMQLPSDAVMIDKPFVPRQLVMAVRHVIDGDSSRGA